MGAVTTGNDEVVFLFKRNHQVNEADYSNYGYYQTDPNLCYYIILCLKTHQVCYYMESK